MQFAAVDTAQLYLKAGMFEAPGTRSYCYLSLTAADSTALSATSQPTRSRL